MLTKCTDQVAKSSVIKLVRQRCAERFIYGVKGLMQPHTSNIGFQLHCCERLTTCIYTDFVVET
jgi:hypothetical protein